MKTILITHGGCSDGYASAFIYQEHHPETKIYEYQHNTVPFVDQLINQNIDYQDCNQIVLCDILPAWEQLKPMIETWLSSNSIEHLELFVFDHHKTNLEYYLGKDFNFASDIKRSLQRYVDTVDKQGRISVEGYCALDRSATGLVWEYSRGHLRDFPTWCRLVQDRDIWQKQFKDTDVFSLVFRNEVKSVEDIRRLGFSVDHKDNRSNAITRIFIQRGRDQFKLIELMIESEEKMTKLITLHDNRTGVSLKGYLYNGGCAKTLNSQMGNHFSHLEEGCFAILYQVLPNGNISCAVRSRKDVDSSFISTYYGGGGHPQASGFTLTPDKTSYLFDAYQTGVWKLD